MKRRTWLTAAFAGLVSTTVKGAAPSRASSIDPADPHRLYAALRFGRPGQPVFWWMGGTRYGLVDNELIPFFEMHVGSVHVREDLDADRYRIRSASALYFTPLGEASLLTEWDNPITRRPVRLSYSAPSVSETVYSLSRGILVEPALPGARVERDHRIGAVRIAAGHAQLDELSRVRIWRNPAPTPQKVHDAYTWSASIDSLSQPGGFVAAAVAFNDFNDWSPRFEMGNRPGTGVARCAGYKVARLDDMPTNWRQQYERLHAGTFESLA